MRRHTVVLPMLAVLACLVGPSASVAQQHDPCATLKVVDSVVEELERILELNRGLLGEIEAELDKCIETDDCPSERIDALSSKHATSTRQNNEIEGKFAHVNKARSDMQATLPPECHRDGGVTQ